MAEVKKHLGLLFSFASLVGCASGASRSASENYHRKVVSELQVRNRSHSVTPLAGRIPASSLDPKADLNATLEGLRKVKPAKFEVYVFAKISNIAEKSATEAQVDLAKPQVFEISPVAITTCEQFISKGFSKINSASDAFAKVANPKSTCGVVEVTSQKTREMNRALIRPGDRLRERIFIDENFATHAIDHEIFRSSQNVETVRMKLDPREPSSSGLTIFPIDLPNFADVEKGSVQAVHEAFTKNLDGLARYQLGKVAGPKFALPSCQGFVFEYRDYYGSSVKTGWCIGQPWPQYVETDRFIAVTQNLRGEK